MLKLRKELTRRLQALSPDVFIGIDAPDFNLGLEIRLRRSGIRTIQYVSPTVWAWRQRRVRKIGPVLDRLPPSGSLDPRQARMAELRFYGGLTVPEVAEVMSLSERTVAREWAMVRAWLRRELS